MFFIPADDFHFFPKSQVGPGVWPALLRLWETGNSHMGVDTDVCLHPAGSLLHSGVLGVFVPQLPFQVGAVHVDWSSAVCYTDLHAGIVPNLHGRTPPAAASLTVYCYIGAGECVCVCVSRI